MRTALLSVLLTAALVCGAVLDAADKDSYSLGYDLTHRDKIDLIVMGEHYGAVSLYWKEEVARRYSDAVVVLGHGGPGEDGFWAIEDQITGELMPMTEMVRKVRERFPYRRIVIISCNPAHQYLDSKNVSYALDSVWFYPDRMVLTDLSDIFSEPYVGDIFEFVEN